MCSLNGIIFAASEGIDYDAGPYTAIFYEKRTRALVRIHINDDDILEDDETFTLTIDPSSTPDGVSSGQATVTIVDDDRKCI